MRVAEFARARPARAAAIGATVLAIAGALVFWLMAAHPADAAGPYADASADGTITLYDAAGHVVTSGDIGTHPFVSKAVGTRAASAPYDSAGRTATLLAFQPRRGATPLMWSGDTLTASVTYPDAAHPAATATASDFSLSDFLAEFPPRWDGVIELRLYLGAPGHATRTTSYAATFIRITGGRWSVASTGGQS